jgi:hypothetical protein
MGDHIGTFPFYFSSSFYFIFFKFYFFRSTFFTALTTDKDSIWVWPTQFETSHFSFYYEVLKQNWALLMIFKVIY